MSAYGKVNKTEFGLELIRVLVKVTVRRAVRLRQCSLRELPLQFACEEVNPRRFSKGQGKWYSRELLLGVCHPVLQILTLFRTKECHFPHPFSDLASKIHTHFQTWLLGNYFTIITSAEREVKDSRRSGMYQSYNFLTRLGKQSL